MLFPENLKLSNDLELAIMQLSLNQKNKLKFIDFMIELLKLGKHNKKQILKYESLWAYSSVHSSENLLHAFLNSKILSNFSLLNKMKELSLLQNERSVFWDDVELALPKAKELDTSFVMSLEPKKRSKALENEYKKLF